jgi:YidC/Oxa1 family membrane protein insertase
MTDNRNVILAIVLSMLVLFGWQFFVAGPQLEQAQRQAELAAQQQAAADGTPVAPTAPGQAAMPATDGTQSFGSREQAIAASQRITIETGDLEGSINLTGARIDDLRLKQYRETVDPASPIITLLTPAGAPNAYFAEEGWVPVQGSSTAVPNGQTVWSVEGGNTVLTAETPVTLVWDNGAGLIFRRTISVDEHYLFTVNQTIENQTGGDVALHAYARVTRHGTPQVQNFFIQHEGPHGVLGSNNLVSYKYGDLQKEQQVTRENTTGWLGFSDKYWATAVMPPANSTLDARFSWTNAGGYDHYQTTYVETTPVVVAAGGTASRESYLFAGAKE